MKYSATEWLYNMGHQSILAGNWNIYGSNGNISVSFGETIYFSGSGQNGQNSYKLISTPNPIDITKYNKMLVYSSTSSTGSMSINYTISFGVGINHTNMTIAGSGNTSSSMKSIDISTLSGDYYPIMQFSIPGNENCAGNCTVTLVAFVE